MNTKILLKFPTRQRTARFLQTLNLYQTLSNNLADIRIVVTCDVDDQTMNNDAMHQTLERLGCQVHYGSSKTKIEACNADIPSTGWDILVLASDDMLPRVQGWDDIIRENMAYYYPDYDGVLNFHDGHQGDKINTLPIMGVNWYRRFGYIYYPAYQTQYCDTELTEVSRIFNRETYIPQVIIEHMHPYSGAVPMDELYIRNNNTSFDCQLFKRRKAKNFYIPRVAIIQPGRTGDILITLPIAKLMYDQNCQVFWKCPKEYHDIFQRIHYATPYEAGNHPENIDRYIDLSFGFGGTPESWWQANKENFDSFVRAKYFLAGVNPAERWNLKWGRNERRERALYMRLVHHEEYILTHECTHSGRIIELDLPNKIMFEPVQDFTIFDWYEIINRAKEIHCIDSALANFIEGVPEFWYKKKHIYIGARESFAYLRSIYQNNWIYE